MDTQNLKIYNADGSINDASGQVTVPSIDEMTSLDNVMAFGTGTQILVSNDTMNRLFEVVRNSTLTPDGSTVVAMPKGGVAVMITDVPQAGAPVDYIVIGSSPAGCAFAKRVTDPSTGPTDNQHSCLILEHGKSFLTDLKVLQGAPFGDFGGGTDPLRSSIFLCDVSVPGPNPGTILSGPLGGLGSIPVQDIGDGVGGSTLHNYLQAVFGSTDIFDDATTGWAAVAGDPSWTFANLLPIREEVETFTPNGTSGAGTDRGTNGPLFVTQDPDNYAYFGAPPAGQSAAVLASIATATNAPVKADYNENATTDIATSLAQWFSTPTPGFPVGSQRSWAQSAYLNTSIVDAQGHGIGGRPIQLTTSAEVVDILFDLTGSRPKAVGVRYILAGDRSRVFEAYAKKGVIISAGAIMSPGLLERAGVGDPAVLGPLGITVIKANTNVGNHVQCHLITPMMFPLNPAKFSAPFQILYAYTDSSGTVEHPTNHASDGVRRAQLQFVVGLSALPPAITTQIAPSSPFNSVSSLVANVRPYGRGTVHVKSTDPSIKPHIFYSYLDPTAQGPGGPTDNDLANAIANMKSVANVSLEYTKETHAALSVTAVGVGTTTYGGFASVNGEMIGRSIIVTGAATPTNNGEFLIVGVGGPTSVITNNPAGVTPDANDGAITGEVRAMPIWPPASHFPGGAHPNYGPEGGTAFAIAVTGLAGVPTDGSATGQFLIFLSGPNAGVTWTIDHAVDATQVVANGLFAGAVVDAGPTPWIIPGLGLSGVAAAVAGVTGSDFQLEADIRSVYVQANHTVGSCRMAATEADGVVDGNLDVFGVDGLSVCDASIMPSIVTANTSFVCYVIGLKKALHARATA